jgi:hypothetical protein
MKHVLPLRDLEACIRYQGAAARRFKAIQFASALTFDRGDPATRSGTEIAIVMADAMNASARCGIYSLQSRVTFRPVRSINVTI